MLSFVGRVPELGAMGCVFEDGVLSGREGFVWVVAEGRLGCRGGGRS